MKRIALFLLILILLFVITFGLSLVLFPKWVTQENWAHDLTKKIFIIGLAMSAESIFAYLLSYLFEDKEFKERILFVIGNKYKGIAIKLDSVTQVEINKEKQSRKYIPNIFIESTEVKEKIRYFCEPFLFFPKIVEQTERRLHNSYIVNILKQVHYPIALTKAQINRRIRSRESLYKNIRNFRDFLNQKMSLTDILIRNSGVGIKPEYMGNIPSGFSHIYDYAYPNLQYYHSYEEEINQAKENLDLLSNNVLILKGLAGHGKTNLLCDFAENFLLRKEHKCIYLPAREFNYLGAQETIEQFISRIFFSESEYQFPDILRLIKFDKNIDFLFVLIDGLNEHKNLDLFSIALEQFIQRCNGFNIKIILTCRSEYFDDRFGNLLLLEKLSLIDVDAYQYIHRIPHIHQNALISKYFSEFNVLLEPDRVDQDIISVFNQDKLLLRIFCEAYEHEKPAQYLRDLYKLEIFNKYYEKKLTAIPGLDRCLTEIITWMIEHHEFDNIQILHLSEQTRSVIDATAHENIILRKDIIVIPGIAFGKSEVMNFVYGEFRDFLIASRIIANWRNNDPISREQIRLFTESRSTISEGIQRYLCLWGVMNDQRELLSFLSSFSWFNLVFINAVIDSPDRYHTDFIVEIIRRLFQSDSISTLHIVFYLSHRVDVYLFPVLNIDLLFTCLSELSETEYLQIVSGALNEERDYKTSYISYLCHSLLKAFQEKRVPEQSWPQLIRLLCYLTGVQDSKFLRYRDSGFGTYPACDTILDLSDYLGKQVVLDQIHRVIRTFKVHSVINCLQEILDHLGEE
jgi:hypothetical protein